MAKTTDGGRPGEHTNIDAASMAKRAASLQVEQRHELDGEIKPQLMIMAAQCARLPHIEDKLNIALRPRMSPTMQAVVTGAIVAGSIALVVIAFAVVTVVRAPAARASVTYTETARR